MAKTDDALLRQALEALDNHAALTRPIDRTSEAIAALRARLAWEPAPQPMSDEQRRAIEDAAYERAAKACEQRLGFVSMFASSYDCHLYNAAVRDCAAAIRALNGDAK